MITITTTALYTLLVSPARHNRDGSTRPEWCGLEELSKCEDAVSRQAVIDAIFSEPLYESGMKKKGADTVVPAIYEKIKSLPSTQPEPIRINLNEPIKVKLTDWGKEIYYHQYDRTNQIAGRKICEPKFPKVDENGYTEFQLWCFIELYGEHMGMTLPNVIEPLEIVYER